MKLNSIEFTQDLIPYTTGEKFEFREGINLLVGDQGAGKSTLLEAVRKEASDFKDHVNIEWGNEGYENYIFLDCEQHNPRVMSDSSAITEEHQQGLIRAIRDGAIGKIIEYFKFKVAGDKENAAMYDQMNDKLLEKVGLFCNGMIDKIGVTDTSRKVASTPDIRLDDLAKYAMRSHGQTILPLLESFKDKKNSLIFVDEPETALSIRSQNKITDMMHDIAANGSQILIATHCQTLIKSVDVVLSLEHRRWMSSIEFIETQMEMVSNT